MQIDVMCAGLRDDADKANLVDNSSNEETEMWIDCPQSKSFLLKRLRRISLLQQNFNINHRKR